MVWACINGHMGVALPHFNLCSMLSLVAARTQQKNTISTEIYGHLT